MATLAGAIAPIKTLTDADLTENGGSYVVRKPKTAVRVRVLTDPGDRVVLQGDVTAVYPITQAQVDAGEYSVIGPAVTIQVIESTQQARGKTAVPVLIVT